MGSSVPDTLDLPRWYQIKTTAEQENLPPRLTIRQREKPIAEPDDISTDKTTLRPPPSAYIWGHTSSHT